MNLRSIVLSGLYAGTLLLAASPAYAVWIVGPYGAYGEFDAEPPRPPKPRIKCEDVLKLDFSGVPFHRDLQRARNLLGDDLELRNFRFTETAEGRVGVHMVFFGGKYVDVYFRYDTKLEKLIVEKESSEEEHLALAMAMVIPVIFPNEFRVIIEIPKFTAPMVAALRRIDFVPSYDLSKIESEDLAPLIFKQEDMWD